MEKIKICFHINNICGCGGTEKATIDLSNALIETNKFEVYIISNEPIKKENLFFDYNHKIHFINIFEEKKKMSKYWFLYIRKIKNLININKFDFIISVDTMFSLVDIFAKKGTKCKHISWDHFSFSYKRNNLIFKLSRFISSFLSDSVIVLTEHSVSKYKKMRKKVNVKKIYNFFECREFDNFSKNKEKVIKILSVGRISKEKGFDLMLEVVERLIKLTKNFKWTVVGDGSELTRLKILCTEKKIEHYVDFVGRKNNVDDYYKSSDIFVLTSKTEGFGLVLIEAMNFHLPTVSFNCVSGPSEIIRNNVNGYLIDDFDVEKMAIKISDLINNDEKRSNFSRNSKIDFYKFSKERILTNWVELFNELGCDYNEKN